MNRSSFLHWFPLIKDLGIPVPRTHIVSLTQKEIIEYHGGESDCFNLSRLENEIQKTIEEHFSLPVFLKTDHYSDKHGWNGSCYLDNIENIKLNLMNIIVNSATVDVMGLPLEAIIVREYIPMDSQFHAFSGQMPVNPERRYFVCDGNVLCHHSYWTEDPLEESGCELPSNWRELLKEMNEETEAETTLLRSYATKVSRAIEGSWSVDFCRSRRGEWFLIDMADGERSWHMPGCAYSRIKK